MDKLFVLDAINFLFRSYYAIRGMTNERGESTNAVYGFIRSIQKLQKEFEPTHLVAVFDGEDNKVARQKLYPDYKIHRERAPDDLYAQFDKAFTYCKLAGIPLLTIPGVEADDTIASIAKWAKKKHVTTFICSSDKDLCQLVDETTFLVNLHKNNLLVDEEKVQELYGVSAKQILDYLALMGDSSDNIPGVKGIGAKGAASLLREFGSLEGIYKHLNKLPAKKAKLLEEEREIAFLSRQLATLDTSVSVPHEESFYIIQEPQLEKLHAFYREENFKTLLKGHGEESPNKEAPPKEGYQLIDSEEKLKTFLHDIKDCKEISLDTETTSLNPLQARLIGIGFSVKKGSGFYLPLNGPLSEQSVLETVKKIIEKSSFSFYGHNIKYDMHVLENESIHLKRPSFDTIVASYFLHPEKRRHNLDQLAHEEFGIEKISYKELTTSGKKRIPLEEVPIEEVSNYCCEDVDVTLQLKEIFEKKLKQKELLKTFLEVEIALIPVLVRMERRGIYVDKEELSTQSQKLTKKLRTIEKTIFDKAECTFNINSPKQLSEVLYDKLDLPQSKKRGQERSTAAPILEKLAKHSPIVSDILEYRTLQKLISTYIDALPKQIDPTTHRIHATFNQSVTATGRLSCQDPNLQNIPIRSEYGKEIRKAFKPQIKEWRYLSADYSQIELRLLAHFSEDPNLIKAFKKGEDIHASTAAMIYDVPLEEVSSQMRFSAKAVNFGILYGQGAYGLCEQLGIPMKEASAFIETYFDRFPSITQYLEECKKKAEKQKFVTTLLGRERALPDIDSKNPHLRAAALRLAINTPLQGSAADLMKLAMINVDKRLTEKSLKGFMILQIHDELIFEFPEEEMQTIKSIVHEEMEEVIKLKVPLVVDIAVGKNWAEC